MKLRYLQCLRIRIGVVDVLLWVWLILANGRGKNMLGLLLCKVRTRIRAALLNDESLIGLDDIVEIPVNPDLTGEEEESYHISASKAKALQKREAKQVKNRLRKDRFRDECGDCLFHKNVDGTVNVDHSEYDIHQKALPDAAKQTIGRNLHNRKTVLSVAEQKEIDLEYVYSPPTKPKLGSFFKAEDVRYIYSINLKGVEHVEVESRAKYYYSAINCIEEAQLEIAMYRTTETASTNKLQDFHALLSDYARKETLTPEEMASVFFTLDELNTILH